MLRNPLCATGRPRHRPRPHAGAWIVALALAGVLSRPALAADHAEAPGTKADPPADIADVYAWHDEGARRLVAVITFDGLRPPTPGQRGTFDDAVLYTLNLDRDGDRVPDAQIHTRFARAADGTVLVVVQGIPGAPSFLVGPVERILRRDGARVFAGLRDDPFFFDLEGFRQTLATGTLSFDGNRDSFAGTNLTAVVIDMDLDAALAGGTTLDLWATTGRTTATASRQGD